MGHSTPRPATSGVELVSTYIEYIGEEELTSHRKPVKYPSNTPEGAAYLIGQGCLELVTGNDKLADSVFRYIRSTVTTVITKPECRWNPDGSRLVHLFHLADMLLSRDQPHAVEAFRKATYTESLVDLKNTQTQIHTETQIRQTSSGRHLDHLFGARTEQCAEGLLTRRATPGTLAVQALTHHDRSRDPKTNYDLLIVHSKTEETPPSIQKIQSKRSCLGFCNNGRADHGDELRSRYLEDIALISEHCDLRGASESSEYVRRWLAMEAKTQTSEYVTAMLDTRTDYLLDIVTDPQEWRMGLIPNAGPTNTGLAA